MTPNDLKKGTRVVMRDRYEAVLADSKKGNIRNVDAENMFGGTNIGSAYAHDIVGYYDEDGQIRILTHTKGMTQCREMNTQLFGG